MNVLIYNHELLYVELELYLCIIFNIINQYFDDFSLHFLNTYVECHFPVSYTSDVDYATAILWLIHLFPTHKKYKC